MADPIDLTGLMPDARDFLTELSSNNDREWFNAHKARYDSRLKRPAEKLLADMSHWLEREMDVSPRTKLFRPHRDVRFTEDKTPYHTHLHMMWSLADGRAWMLGISPDYATFGAGLMRFDKDQQEAWREAVAGEEGAELAALLEAGGWRVDPPAMKRVPAPYNDDHPREHLLRYKGFVAWSDDLEEPLTEDPVATLQARFIEFMPLMDWLADVA